MPHDLPKAYDPTAIEDHWAEYWVREKLFAQPTPTTADQNQGLDGQSFTILLPPPNVTGNLHMGHMFEHTESDILARWHRMRGERVLWIPGTDHAGIATQMLVERQVVSEGTTRQKMGREAFVERVWDWRRHYGGAILGQMKRLGASVDWDREYFTMDERLSVAVREAFVRLYEQGLIYRGAYIVNWCPRCQTAISDLEVVYDEHKGHLWEIRYPVHGDDGRETGEFLTIATTRPETMLGDVAVAIHPDDERYTHLHGKKLRLPLMNREIPIILDEWVSPEFGTGAVKVTPAHDPNDFALGERHHLPSINVMDDTAQINENGGPYAGLDRYVARKRIVEDLDRAGPPGRRQGPRPQRRPLRPLQDRRRAAPFHAMVRQDSAARGQGDRGSEAGRGWQQGDPHHPRTIRKGLPRLDGQHPRLVHLAAAVVGPSHSRLALRGLPQDHRGARRSHRMRPLRLGQDHAGDRCSGHVVLVGPAAGFGIRLAQDHRRRIAPISTPSIPPAFSSPASTSSSSG